MVAKSEWVFEPDTAGEWVMAKIESQSKNVISRQVIQVVSGANDLKMYNSEDDRVEEIPCGSGWGDVYYYKFLKVELPEI